MKRSSQRFGLLVYVAVAGCSLGVELPPLPPGLEPDASVDSGVSEEDADAAPEDASADAAAADAPDAALESDVSEDAPPEEIGCEAAACAERPAAEASCAAAGCVWTCGSGFGDVNGDLNAPEASDGCECTQQEPRVDQVCDAINQSCASSADTCCADREWVHRLSLPSNVNVEQLGVAVRPGEGLVVGWRAVFGDTVELRSFREDGASLAAAALPSALTGSGFALGLAPEGFAVAVRRGEVLELHLLDGELAPQAGSPVRLSSQGSIGSLALLELPGQLPLVLGLRYNATFGSVAGCTGPGFCAVAWGYLAGEGGNPGQWVELSVTPMGSGNRSRIRGARSGDLLAITWLELANAGLEPYALRGWVVDLTTNVSRTMTLEPSVPNDDYALLAEQGGFRVITPGLNAELERQLFQRRFELTSVEPARTQLALLHSFVQATSLEDGRALLMTRDGATLWAEAFAVDGAPSAVPTAPIYASSGGVLDAMAMTRWERRGLFAVAQHSSTFGGPSAIDLIAVEPDALVPACALPELRAP